MFLDIVGSVLLTKCQKKKIQVVMKNKKLLFEHEEKGVGNSNPEHIDSGCIRK